jgi:hypothetical protein
VDSRDLKSCPSLNPHAGQPLPRLDVTGDTAVRIRAQALGGIRPLALPDKYQRERER